MILLQSVVGILRLYRNGAMPPVCRLSVPEAKYRLTPDYSKIRTNVEDII